ncbi:MAG: hypothetical protein J6J35_08315 [Alphaproteobacteria bacterium]|nr:hypothetical protein [Alphaproteobacteria bacterium]
METKNVTKEALKRSVFSAMWFILIACVMSLTSCESEQIKPRSNTVIKDTIEIIKDHYYDSERTLAVVPTVKDTLVKSDVTFKQTSTLSNSKEDIYVTFTPGAYLNVRLSKPRIDVKSKDEVPVEVAREYILSQSPYKSGTTLGEDVVKTFEFTDGQVATVSYGYRYTAIIINRDTLATPHAEISSVSFDRAVIDQFEAKTETEDPYRVTLVFNAPFTTKGVSGREVTETVTMKPWYRKVVTTAATVVEDVSYSGRFVGCPFSAYEITEKVKTNKNEFTNTYTVDLSLNVITPEKREQPSLDSLFATSSRGKLVEKQFSEAKSDNGFTVRTMTGTYTSVNTGKENKTSVESQVSFTYQFPVMFESQYGSYQIAPIKLQFEELGFSINKISETEESKTFRSVNSIQAKLGDCTLDVIDEEVILKMQQDKPQDVVPVDSVYTLSGSGDEYIVDKKIIWSDGTTTSSKYTYDGRHSAKALAFGEVITSSLNWSNGSLDKRSQSSSTEEKTFSSYTKFVAVYTTTNWQADATNRIERGSFKFVEETPVVTFKDGDTTKSFPARKYQITGLGANVASNYNIVVRNQVSYKAYDYDYNATAAFNGGDAETLVSEGLLLIKADETGNPTYKAEQSWNGNTATLKVIKTTPHSFAEDEVETFTKTFTVGLTPFEDGKVTAENTNFAATEAKTEQTSSTTDTPWKITTHKQNFIYTVSNGKVSRGNIATTLTDGVVVFDNGEFAHTFDLTLSAQKSESFGTKRQDGNYDVTPHKLTVTASGAGKTLSETSTTDIYVKRAASITGHEEKTKVYPDGTVDAEIVIKKDDGTSQTIKASDTFGKRFAFDFKNVSAQEKVVTNVNHKASASAGQPTTNTLKQGAWSVTEYRYPYNHALSNGTPAENINSAYSYKNYEFVYTDNSVGTVKIPMPVVAMSNKSLNISKQGTANGYINHNANVVVNGTARGTEGSYTTDLAVTHILKVKDNTPVEPDKPHLGKPKGFMVTATYDPTSNVTRRAFCFNWENGVTYAVCLYETELPSQSDFMFKEDTYQGYNSVGYDKNNSNHWQPARGVDSSDAIRWYDASGKMFSAIDKDLSCMVIGWKNIVKGKYAMEIPGYTYTMDGYNITVKAPSGKTVTFNSHHK